MNQLAMAGKALRVIASAHGARGDPGGMASRLSPGSTLLAMTMVAQLSECRAQEAQERDAET